MTSEKVFKLEYGQAHIAIRTGPKPDVDDYVVQPFFDYKMAHYAHSDYLAEKGSFLNDSDVSKHSLITVDDLNTKFPAQQWMKSHVPPANIVFRSNSRAVKLNAVTSGLGIGFLFEHDAIKHADLIEIFPSKKEWRATNWILTHGDRHHSEKMQAFLRLLKGEAYREAILSWLEK
ncbi:MAG: DNA-binding transcriptional LysR family regulator [Granulosicoccus sp.]